MTPEKFRRLGHQVVDWVADYRECVARLPVTSQVTPAAVKARLPEFPPAVPEKFDAILGDLDRVILPGLSHWQHPRFFGYFTGCICSRALTRRSCAPWQGPARRVDRIGD